MFESGNLNVGTGKAPPLVGIKDALYAALQANGVDDRALQQAFTLCQKFGDDGVREMQGILMNLLKNMA